MCDRFLERGSSKIFSKASNYFFTISRTQKNSRLLGGLQAGAYPRWWTFTNCHRASQGTFWEPFHRCLGHLGRRLVFKHCRKRLFRRHHRPRASVLCLFSALRLAHSGPRTLLQNQVISGILISNVAFLVACVAFYRWVRLDHSEKASDTALLVFILFPASFIFTAVMTEGLFTALAIGCLLAARRDRFGAAAALAFAAVLTRSMGVFLVVPLAYEIYRRHKSFLAPTGCGWQSRLWVGRWLASSTTKRPVMHLRGWPFKNRLGNTSARFP